MIGKSTRPGVDVKAVPDPGRSVSSWFVRAQVSVTVPTVSAMNTSRAHVVAGLIVSVTAAWALPKVLGRPGGPTGQLVTAATIYALHEAFDAPLARELARLGV
jgi:hypothetical protein